MSTIRRRVAALFAALAMLLCVAAAESPADYDMSAPERLASGHLFAQSALLVDEDSGEVLFSKDSRVRMYPASTTKIMTLLLALESDIPLDREITVPAEAADIPQGSSVIPVKPGDELTFSDLLYGFMLTSGNDGANTIAVLVDGSIEAFVQRMNARAQALGCEGTHYVNAHGYHDPGHYTTAQDLSIIARQAMRNATFREIVAAPTRTLAIRRNGEAVTATVENRNSLLLSGGKYYYPDCTGIKTGHHNKAGWCFVGSAQRDGKRLICVVLNCELEDQKWYDAARLFEYGFTRYQPVAVGELLDAAKDRFATVQVENADPADSQGGMLALDLTEIEGGEQAVQLVAGSEAARSAAVERVAEGARIEWERSPEAPVRAGERLGTLSLELDDGIRVSAALTASRDVNAPPVVTAAPAPVVTQAPGQAATDAPQSAPARSGSALPVLVGLGVALAAACAATAAAVNAGKRRARARKRRRRARHAAARRPQDAQRRRG